MKESKQEKATGSREDTMDATTAAGTWEALRPIIFTCGMGLVVAGVVVWAISKFILGD